MRKYITLIIVLVLVSLSCVGLSACNNKVERVTVTFDYNVGNLVFSIEQQQIMVEKNALIGNYPGNGIDERKIDGYHIEGWYTAQTDSNGNVLVDDNRFVKLDQKWDFESDKIADDIILFANWEETPVQEGYVLFSLYYQIYSSEKGHISLSSEDVYGRFKYNESTMSSYCYEINKNKFEYYECEGTKYRVLFWYIPKIEDSHIMWDENGYAIIDKIWDLNNDVISSDMSALILFAKTEPIDE